MAKARCGYARLALLTALLLAGCQRAPRVAVIGLAGTGSDPIFLRSFADSLRAGPHPVRVEIFDGGQSDDAYRSALKTAQSVVHIPGLVAVVGHRDSRSTLVVGPVYRDAGVPLVVPNATSRAIEKLGPLVFMMAADVGEEGAYLARVAVGGLHAHRVTIFHLTDEFGMGLDRSLRSALDSSGVSILDDMEYGVTRLSCPHDFEPLVDASLLGGRPDVVILGSRTPDAACVVRLFAERSSSIRFLAGDGVEAGDGFARRIGAAAAARMWIVQFWSPDEDSVSRAFSERFQRVTGHVPDQGSALRWDGVRVVAQAVREVGPDRKKVVAYLRALGHGRPPYRGVTGNISFGPGAPRPLIVTDAWGRPVPREGW